MEEETVNYNDNDDEYEVSEIIIKTSGNEDSNTLMKGYKKKKANYKTNPIITKYEKVQDKLMKVLLS